jgi:hypothetical protein
MSPQQMDSKPGLLAIVELGGYPNFMPLYEKLGFETTVLSSQRKARNYLKKITPKVIVCEYNFQSDFRDRTSNLETLLSVLQKRPEIRLIVFYMPERKEKFSQVEARFAIFASLALPINTQELEEKLLEALAYDQPEDS